MLKMLSRAANCKEPGQTARIGRLATPGSILVAHASQNPFAGGHSTRITVTV